MKIASVEQVTTFKTLKTAVAAQFQRMLPTGLFHVDIEKDVLWQSYLSSFPEGSNPLYQKRTEHDCSCCRSFVRTLGGVVNTHIGGEGYYTGEVLQDDGTYGSSAEYIYWWDSKGVYHQQYITGGMILHISDQPLSVRSVVINMELAKPE